MCLKIENYCLKIVVKIRVSEKMYEKNVKYCLKTENCYLETLTKHSLNSFFSVFYFSLLLLFGPLPHVNEVIRV